MPTDYLYRDIREWKNSPIQKIVLTDIPSGDRVFFFYPTDDSGYDVKASARRGGHGDNRPVGWLFTLTFRCLQNNAQGMLARLDAYVGHEMGATIILKPDPTATHGRTVSITLPAPVGVVWQLAKDKTGPVFEIELTKALTSLYQISSVTIWDDDTETITDPIT